MHTPAHKAVPSLRDYADKIRETTEKMEIDFDSDEPLACPLDKADGQPCEGCQ